MLAKRAVHLPLSLWNLTPDPTPDPSPASSVFNFDLDEKAMDSRPLSLAIPSSGFCPMRPTLDEVLTNTASYPYTLSAFMAYLSQNHCLETLEFTMEAERYGETYRTVSRMLAQSPIVTECPQTQHLRMLWQRLLSAYIMPGSPREINLASEVRDALLADASATLPPPPETLDAAVRRMHDLMEESIFIHFLNSHSVVPPSGSPYLDSTERMNLSNTSLDDHHGPLRRVTSRGRRVSPQPSLMDFLSSRDHVPRRLTKGGPAALAKTGSRVSGHSSMGSGDSGSPLTDDTGSLGSSPVVGEPMTPPTTPPSSDLGLHQGYSPKSRPSDNAWKKVGMKFGFNKKRPGGSTSRDPRLEE